MNGPFFHNRPFLLVAFIAAWGFVSLSVAEQPAVTVPPAEATSPRTAGARPQVIYHLPPASNYAATLHSQAKTQRSALPVDSSMPASLQMSRAAANEAAAKAPPESAAGSQPRTNSAAAAPKRAVKRQSHSPAPSLRQPPGKGHGHGNGHGNKSHRK